MKNGKGKILAELKKKGTLSTSAIASRLNLNYHRTLKLLEDLESEKLVQSEEGIKGRFWKLKEAR